MMYDKNKDIFLRLSHYELSMINAILSSETHKEGFWYTNKELKDLTLMISSSLSKCALKE